MVPTCCNRVAVLPSAPQFFHRATITPIVPPLHYSATVKSGAPLKYYFATVLFNALPINHPAFVPFNAPRRHHRATVPPFRRRTDITHRHTSVRPLTLHTQPRSLQLLIIPPFCLKLFDVILLNDL